MTIID